jgi:hypothetical protein
MVAPTGEQRSARVVGLRRLIPLCVVLRTFIALLATALLLALPGAALAQSAGDDQYADPFGDTQEPSNGGQSDGDQPVDDGGADPQPSTPAPAPAPAPSGAETTSSATASDGATLPRTGFEVVLLLAAAFPLLLGGIAIRRVAS